MSKPSVFIDSDESESGEDFSASEDEWVPGKHDKKDSEDEFENDDDDDDGDELVEMNSSKTDGDKKKKPAQESKKGKNISIRKQSSSLRSKLYRKYKPPPKTIKTSTASTSSSPTSSKNIIPAKIATILSNSKYEQRKAICSTSATAESESDSSGDECLVDPKKLDLNSEFFDVNNTSKVSGQSDAAPSFDCNAGMKLSDSETDADEHNGKTEEENTDTKSSGSIIGKINQKSANEARDFSDLQDFTKRLETAKEHLRKLQKKELLAPATHDDADVKKLLSLGEGASTSTAPVASQSRKRKKNESDGSDWENVTDDADDDNASKTLKDIQITIGNNVVRGMSRDKKKALDLEACLKRRLNREIKDKQVIYHRVSVLSWIGHGNHINRILNNMRLMEMCLKLLPSKNSYPDGDTEMKYFISLTKWFSGLFHLKSAKPYCALKGLSNKILSLALQINTKQVICKTDLVLIFVSLLRAIGIQCRLVINFAVAPLRPPQNELLSISSKAQETKAEKNETKMGKAKGKQAEMSLAKKVKVSAKKMNNLIIKKHAAESPKAKELVSIKNGKTKDRNAEDCMTKSVQVSVTPMRDSFIKRHTEDPPATRQKKIEKDKKKVKHSETTTMAKELATNGKAKDRDCVTKSVQVSVKPMGDSFIKRHTEDSPATKQEKIEKDKKNVKHSEPTTLAKKLTVSVQKMRGSFVQRRTDGILSPEKSNEVVPTVRSESLKSKKAVDTKEKAGTSKEINTSQQSENVKKVDLAKLISPKKTRLRARKEQEANLSNTKPDKQIVVEEKSKTFATKRKKEKATPANKLPQMDGGHDDLPKKKSSKRAKAVPKSNNSDSDSDFAQSPPKRIRPKTEKAKPKLKVIGEIKRTDRRVLSTDVDEEPMQIPNNCNSLDFWVEVYAEKEKKWLTIDPVKNKVDAIDHVRKLASKPIIYVLAWNNDNSIRDVTPRYCAQWHTTTRKLRAEKEWFDDAIHRFAEKRNPRTIIEDMDFSKLHMDTPLPKSISEFKNHPLYALERHLLKFEAIYPSDALTLGFIRNEPIYARECVHALHSREIWVKQARTVKIGEKPYKIVKARPKWDRMLNQMLEAQPLEIFGFWQTQAYEPPVAENGIVPRNPYGNVELFKPEMLPIGTRHIQLPSLNRTCKKMNVDCAQAVIGFDFHSGSSHPTFDGFVVCEEFADLVIAQWYQDQEELEQKQLEKYEARVYGNWKKLIKGLLIRERLKRKFNFGQVPKTADR